MEDKRMESCAANEQVHQRPRETRDQFDGRSTLAPRSMAQPRPGQSQNNHGLAKAMIGIGIFGVLVAVAQLFVMVADYWAKK